MRQEAGSDVETLVKFIPKAGDIVDEDLKQKTASVYLALFREGNWKDITDQPATNAVPVSNVDHTNAVVELCLGVADTLERHHKVKVNRDYLIASAVLHDASKLVEYEPAERGEKRTKLGELGQHTMRCVSLMLSSGMPLEVVHAVLAHTPQSAAIPKTVEAIIVYFVDALDYNVLRVTNGLGPDIMKK